MGKHILPNLTNSQEPEPRGAACFCRLEPEPPEKITGAGAAWGKNQEPEPLEIGFDHSMNNFEIKFLITAILGPNSLQFLVWFQN